MILEAYNSVDWYLNGTFPMNDKDTREKVAKLLEFKLLNVVDEVICDESNNPPDIVDSNMLIARLVWGTTNLEYHYIDFKFGGKSTTKYAES